MTFKEFLSKVDEFFLGGQVYRQQPNEPISVSNQLRYGQALMNVLYDVWPEKYNEIKGTDIDCFYSNSTVNLTLSKLEQEWKDNE